MTAKKIKPRRTHSVVIDFGDTYVARKADRPMWPGFRIWPSVEWPIPRTTDYKKFQRSINTLGSPPFDIFRDWLMDFSTIAADGMKRSDWQNFRRLVLVHLPNCPFRCWYCFNDAWPATNPRCKSGRVTAREILDHFKDQQIRDSNIPGNECNVLRISGGEPFTSPQLIEDIAKEINADAAFDAFLWVDTNLYHIAHDSTKDEAAKALKALSGLGPRVAIHACFHGTTDQKVKEITGKDATSMDLLFEGYKLLLDPELCLNVYPRINPCAMTAEEAEAFFLRLYELDPLSPQKVYLGPVELYYPPAADRMTRIQKDSTRENPILHPSSAVIYWWNYMMQATYNIGYCKVPRHLSKALEDQCRAKSEVIRLAEDNRQDRPDFEFIYFSKGSYRESYALKVLESIALPPKARTLLEIEDKYVEPNFASHSKIFSDAYKSKYILIVATHSLGRAIFHTVLTRWAKVIEIKHTPSSINIIVELLGYPNNRILQENDKVTSGTVIYDTLAKYSGQKNLPIDGYFCMQMALPRSWEPNEVTQESTNPGSLLDIVECLSEVGDDRIKRNIYYRIEDIVRYFGDSSHQPVKARIIDGELIFYPGDEIRIELETYTKYLGFQGYPSENSAKLMISCTEDEKKIKIISQKQIQLTKFGHPVIKLKIRSEYEELRGEIVIQPVTDEARIAETRLPFRTIVDED